MAMVLACARRSALRAAAFVTAVAVLGGCAQIVTRSTVEVVARPEAPVLVLGAGGEITGRGVEAEWSQDGDRLVLQLIEHRACTSVRHVPVMRVERVDRRTAGGAMWFEYGIGAGALAAGMVGLLRPASFSQTSTVNAEGQVVKDTGAGYRIGGILTGVGVILLTAAVVDTRRSRDEVRYTEAYRRDTGGAMECAEPRAPLQRQTVELLVGKWSIAQATGEEGEVRFLLPAVKDLPAEAREVIEATAVWEAARAEAEAEAVVRAEAEEAARRAAEAEEAARAKKGKKSRAAAGATAAAAATEGEPAVAVDELGPRPEPLVVTGVLRIDSKRALAVDFVVPYDGDAAKGYEGRASVEPGPSGPAVGKPSEP